MTYRAEGDLLDEIMWIDNGAGGGIVKNKQTLLRITKDKKLRIATTTYILTRHDK